LPFGKSGKIQFYLIDFPSAGLCGICASMQAMQLWFVQIITGEGILVTLKSSRPVNSPTGWMAKIGKVSEISAGQGILTGLS